MLIVTDQTTTQSWATVGAVPIGTLLRDAQGQIYLRHGDALFSLSNLNISYPLNATIVQGMREVMGEMIIRGYA